MKIIDRLKNYYNNQPYFISLYPDHIYIMNYKDIIDFSETKLKIRFNDFILNINGINLKIIRKNKIEFEINGKFSKLEIINEE